MIDYRIFKDLENHGIPILAVGDHGQLPPIRGDFNLMEDPDITLEKIMRQAEDNPIIKMSIMAREDGVIPYCDLGAAVKTRERSFINKHDFNDIGSIVLCATNKTRVAINSFARKILQKEGNPLPGEPLICLSNNNFKKVFNGNIGILKEICSYDEIFSVKVDMGDFTYHGDIFKDQFNKKYLVEKPAEADLFDFAYAITTHKSQGSEWRYVTLYEERMGQSDDNWRRWLYTAVTRAKESLLIIK
jgi:exodeoxyribonuclease-5